MLEKIRKLKAKKNVKPIVGLTAYSYSVSKILDKFCDFTLVGDSLGNVLYGMKNTHKVTLDMIINHARSVKLGNKRSLLVVDMPKGTYKNPSSAKKNAIKIIKAAQCDAIKLESNKGNYKIIRHLVNSGVSVMGHIGFTPQFKKKFKVEGVTKRDENKLIKDALEIQKAGAFSIILECIAKDTSKKITKLLKIPTIGIGASINCDGQILVTDDIIGLSGFYPKFIKKYANIDKLIETAVKKYKNDVVNKRFPKKDNSF